MAKRKITLQNLGSSSEKNAIETLVQDMGSADLGFTPTDQTVYEIDLERIFPDPLQPRNFLPFDLREKLVSREITPHQAMQDLVNRADKGDRVAMLVLGGTIAVADENTPDDDKGLVALAQSIKSVGLRQPINVYSITQPDSAKHFYQIGEGERRYWAHQLLLLQGESRFNKIRCIIEAMPEDRDVVLRRQQAENAARQDLSAIARARSINQIYERFRMTMGTRVPGETTIKLPTKHELNDAVGQEVKAFTGRAIGGRMVRNYLRLLNLRQDLQDLAEAAQLTEKQLRPVMGLKTDAEQEKMITQIIDEQLSSRAVLSRVKGDTPSSSLRRVSRTTVEQRLEKRLFQTALTIHEISMMGEEPYQTILEMLSDKVKDHNTRMALIEMRRLLDDLIDQADDLLEIDTAEIALSAIKPPVSTLAIPATQRREIEKETASMSGLKTIRYLLSRYNDDAVFASAIQGEISEWEDVASQIKAEESTPAIVVTRITPRTPGAKYEYEISERDKVYWAVQLLRERKERNTKSITAQITS